MATSYAHQRAVNKYAKANYDNIQLRVPKGQREVIQTHAASMNESTNAFIKRAIQETMERDSHK